MGGQEGGSTAVKSCSRSILVAEHILLPIARPALRRAFWPLPFYTHRFDLQLDWGSCCGAFRHKSSRDMPSCLFWGEEHLKVFVFVSYNVHVPAVVITLAGDVALGVIVHWVTAGNVTLDVIVHWVIKAHVASPL